MIPSYSLVSVTSRYRYHI